MAAKRKDGPRWVKSWISELSSLTDQFRDIKTGAVNFEELGREEYLFRMALSTKNFTLSQRAKEAWAEAMKPYQQRISAAESKKKNGDAATREGAEACICRESGSHAPTTVSNTMGADAVSGDTTDEKSGTSASKNMPRVGQNEARPRIQGGDRSVQGPMSRSPEAAAQSGKDYDQDADNIDDKHNDRGADAATRDGAEAIPSGESRANWASGQSAPRTFKGHKKQFKAPSKEELYAYAQDKGLDEADARDCWEMCESRQWADRDGVQIENWKTFVSGFCKSRQAKRSA